MKIEIYPKCVKPKWMKKGATCYCLGEGNDVFTVDTVETNSATLTIHGLQHGRESFTKLYKTLSELEERRSK